MRPLLLICALSAACGSSTPTADGLAGDGSPDHPSPIDSRAEATPLDGGPRDAASDGPPACPSFAAGVKVGAVASSEVTEASGLIASRKNPGVLWTHNDSGNSARVFALTATGTHLGIYTLAGATADDWEDLATGPGPTAGAHYLYLGDIGDNSQSRPSVVVYRVLEPTVSATQAPATVNLTGVEALVFTYPDGPQNAETLLVDPVTSDLAIVSKASSGTSGVYFSPAPLYPGKPRALTKVATLELGSGALAHTDKLTTGGDVSADGAELLVRTYAGAALFRRAPGTPFWQAFTTPPCKAPLVFEGQGEAIAFDPGGKGYTTVSEGKNQPLYFFARQ